MSWLVFGGSGFVGSAVVDGVARTGIAVGSQRAPRCTTTAATPEALVAEALRTDPALLADLTALMEGHDVVVNAAGSATPSATGDSDLLGANALLPLVLARAADAAGVRRFIHLSSAAVQGRTPMLDETPSVRPFSAYSRSKALAELALAELPVRASLTVILRPTSVQGRGRPTTLALARFAGSPLASVAAPGTSPSPITSVDALADLVLSVGSHQGPVPRIILQPWEGLSVRSVLEAAGGRPRELPAVACRAAVRVGYALSALLRGRLDGQVRRVELMWFGQDQVPGWCSEQGLTPVPQVHDLLVAARHA
ncbi:NAD(P)-dependent oxidoreductase [Arthrobacter agilis]|uniref:NAD-dependent epimerase/dehydratase family protein n=2 Tax=Micrococcaceae TaxID=1268 RepID=UPI002365229C|nr:NAD(P)-dependent oxidoreductase [Arthrobacter agilis]WDF32324.1 NAD(P)-dependent oxidoreductase [Arthrobacter agilis]